jgi:hypothetical protein
MSNLGKTVSLSPLHLRKAAPGKEIDRSPERPKKEEVGSVKTTLFKEKQ